MKNEIPLWENAEENKSIERKYMLGCKNVNELYLTCFSTDKMRHMPGAIIEESIYWQITVFRGWVNDHGSRQQATIICSYSQSGGRETES